MKKDFLKSYFAVFDSIQGFFTVDAALMFLTYNQLIASQGIIGSTLEIGVHHGLSAIIVASMAGPQNKFVAIDLFDDMQADNLSGSGSGNKEEFLKNIQSSFEILDFVRVIQSASTSLTPLAVGAGFSFCHIDGGHSPEETYSDLELCSQILMPGGLLALDDYFNPSFPGVCEGGVRFQIEQGRLLKPIAIGFNKVLFQKEPIAADLNSQFEIDFNIIPKQSSVLWNTPVHYFTVSFLPFFDLDSSSPHSLTLKPEPDVVASFDPQTNKLKVERGRTISLRVNVSNKSEAAFPYGKSTFGLSYHLLSTDGEILKFDNKRTYLEAPLQPGSSLLTELEILAPKVCGLYLVELDLVWEGVLWFKEKGNPTRLVELVVF